LRLAIALGWHSLAYRELLDLVRHAESAGFEAAFVDGDVSQITGHGEADLLDGWTVTAALLASTERIQIGSIRLVHHWNAARLAQATATLGRIAPGRFRFLISIGGQRADRCFGLPFPSARERIAWLDETLCAVRRLWRGEEVTTRGRHVRLSGARIRPCPSEGRLPIGIAAARSQMLEVVATHADVWDVNLPPISSRVRAAEKTLAAACRRKGRDPAEILRSMWIFTRPHRDPSDAGLRDEFRRLNPWLRTLPDDQLGEAIVAGSPEACRRRISEIAESFRLDLPVADLSGLPHDATRRAIDALAPREGLVDSNTG
jgi:alkanesulfonate monooxygenase SsuD/methylene tetrahydromethanopterin reductase-like flavin-dependent oxidoreductase (luciferase family)